jgi:hypothetical protein
MTLCQLIRKHRIPTRVIHITAFADDPEIIRHVQDVHFEKFDPSASSVGEGNDEQAGNSHRQLPDPRSAIAKNRTDWMELVVAGIRSYLYSDRIGAKLDDLFTDSVKGIRHAERAMHGCRDATGGGSVTSRLIDLQGDIRSYWEFLSPALRKRIRSILSVDESRPGDVRVSLIGKVPPASEVPPE